MSAEAPDLPSEPLSDEELSALIQNLGTLAGIYPQWAGLYGKAFRACNELRALRAKVAEEQNRVLREALRRYGEHRSHCNSAEEGTLCICGLRAALGDEP